VTVPLIASPGEVYPARVQQVLDGVLAVLVLYNRRLEESVTFHSLGTSLAAAGAGLDLLVVDNSTRGGGWDGNPTEATWRIRYQRNPSNPGVSAAYLTGARMARRLGKRWMLCLDQDTAFEPGAATAYAAALHAYPDVQLFAPALRAGDRVVSPCRYRGWRGTPLQKIQPGPHQFSSLSVLNSGMCVELAAYRAAGGHDPGIPLDFSDHEFVSRFATRHRDFVVVDTEARHGLSAVEVQCVEDRLTRFDAYCVGALRTSRTPRERAGVAPIALARAAKLALRYGRFDFFTTFFHRFRPEVFSGPFAVRQPPGP
jgi:glycosyltransferase involved in cell wall biosynthesis